MSSNIYCCLRVAYFTALFTIATYTNNVTKKGGRMTDPLQQRIDSFMSRKQREHPDLERPVDELIQQWR